MVKKEKSENDKKNTEFIILQLVVIVYSLATIPSKLASNEVFLSFRFCLFYGALIVLLGIYAVLWQQILKKFPLTIAYASKATAIIWNMLIGLLVFKERITLFNVIGAFVVVIGIIIMVKGEGSNE